MYHKYQQQNTSHSHPAIIYYLLSFNFYLFIFKCVTVEAPEQVTEAELLKSYLHDPGTVSKGHDVPLFPEESRV